MIDHIVIHGELSGDWCLIFDPDRNDYARLFKPGYWSAPYRSLGLRYYPDAGINLSRHPLRAHRQAKRIIADKERSLRRQARRTLRRREAIAKIQEQR